MTVERQNDFIREIIEADLRSGKRSRVVTRFPPEPNGYLHIGHAKSICLNFGLARDFNGVCHLRMDDTDPTKEEIEYVESIQNDVRWLGFEWHDKLFYASDYYPKLYEYAVELIRAGKAYVCSLSEEEVRAYRGTVTEPGKASPFRERSVQENLDLFARMKAGEFDEGAHVLRAKIDMASPNMKMRDPPLYRIRKVKHYRSGDAWVIYPLYDFAHCLSDSLEGITHSICTLEFENNRELYDWFLDNLEVPRPQPRQYEFARLALTYTVLSKRKLLQLVEDKLVEGWDDPRMPTLAGIRRRGVTPEALRAFCDRIGVAKANSMVDMAHLEFSVRDDLNQRAPRVMAVLDPLRVVIENYPEHGKEMLEASYWPHDVPKVGTRQVPFTGEIFIERSDFEELPPKDFRRLTPTQPVRLRYGYVISCTKVIKDASGQVVELRAKYHPESKTGEGPKTKGTIHWVSAADALDAEVRLYDRLFRVERPDAEENFLAVLNPQALQVVQAKLEASLGNAKAGERYQFERHGYFFADPVHFAAGRKVFNRIVALKDSWAKQTAEDVAVEAAGAKATPEPKKAKQHAREAAQAVTRAAAPFDLDAHPAARALVDAHGLPPQDAMVIAEHALLRPLFDEAVAQKAAPRAVANWLVNELQRILKESPDAPMRLRGAQIATLVRLVDDATISSKMAKDVFLEMVATGHDPERIVADQGLAQITDPAALEPVVRRVVAAHQESVARFREGNRNAMGFIVGQVMRETRGKANPALVSELVQKELERPRPE